MQTQDEYYEAELPTLPRPDAQEPIRDARPGEGMDPLDPMGHVGWKVQEQRCVDYDRHELRAGARDVGGARRAGCARRGACVVTYLTCLWGQYVNTEPDLPAEGDDVLWTGAVFTTVALIGEWLVGE